MWLPISKAPRVVSKKDLQAVCLLEAPSPLKHFPGDITVSSGTASQKGWWDTRGQSKVCVLWVTILLSAQLSWGLRDRVRDQCRRTVWLCKSWAGSAACLYSRFYHWAMLLKSVEWDRWCNLSELAQREWPALKSPGNALVSVSSPAFWLLRFNGKAWKVLKKLLFLAPFPARQRVRSGIFLDAKGQAGPPDAL